MSSALGADRYCIYFPRSRFLPPKDHVEMTDTYVNAKYAGETVDLWWWGLWADTSLELSLRRG